MQELFHTYPALMLESQQYIAAQQIVAEHKAAGVPLTTSQLRQELTALHIINANWTYLEWRRWLYQGQVGGQLDWDILTDYASGPICDGPAHRELWCRSAWSLNSWLAAFLAGRCRCRTSEGARWHHQQVYDAAKWATPALQADQHYTIYYLSDPYVGRETKLLRMQRLLQRMLKVRLARLAFNQRYGHEAWRANGMRFISHGVGGGLKKKAIVYLKHAEQIVTELLHFVDIGVTGGSVLADRSPFELSTLIQPALQHLNLSRVPKLRDPSVVMGPLPSDKIHGDPAAIEDHRAAKEESHT